MLRLIAEPARREGVDILIRYVSAPSRTWTVVIADPRTIDVFVPKSHLTEIDITSDI